MRQEDRDQLARYVLAGSLHGVFSHSGYLSVPGWPQTSQVREGSLLNVRRLSRTYFLEPHLDRDWRDEACASARA